MRKRKKEPMRRITILDLKLKEKSLLVNKIVEGNISIIENTLFGILLDTKETLIKNFVEFLKIYKLHKISVYKERGIYKIDKLDWNITLYFSSNFNKESEFPYDDTTIRLLKTRFLSEEGIKEYPSFQTVYRNDSFSLQFSGIKEQSLKEIYGNNLSQTEFDLLTNREKLRLKQKNAL